MLHESKKTVFVIFTIEVLKHGTVLGTQLALNTYPYELIHLLTHSTLKTFWVYYTFCFKSVVNIRLACDYLGQLVFPLSYQASSLPLGKAELNQAWIITWTMGNEMILKTFFTENILRHL